MAKIKRTKGQTTIYKTLHRKLKIATRTLLKTGGEFMCCGRVSSFCSSSGTHRACYSSYDKWNILVVICDTCIPLPINWKESGYLHIQRQCVSCNIILVQICLFLRVMQFKKLIYKMCSRHDIAEILLKLALNTNRSTYQSNHQIT